MRKCVVYIRCVYLFLSTTADHLTPSVQFVYVSGSVIVYMGVAMEDSLLNLAIFYVLWLKVTTTTEQRMLPVPLANGKRRRAKRGLVKPHRAREDLIFKLHSSRQQQFIGV